MKAKRFSEEQIIAVLKEAEAGAKTKDRSSRDRCSTPGPTSGGVRLNFIRPGKPVENAYVESFNGRFRDGCLNEHRLETDSG